MQEAQISRNGQEFTVTRTEKVTMTETAAQSHREDLVRTIASLDAQAKRLAGDRQALVAELTQMDALLNVSGGKNPGGK